MGTELEQSLLTGSDELEGDKGTTTTPTSTEKEKGAVQSEEGDQNWLENVPEERKQIIYKSIQVPGRSMTPEASNLHIIEQTFHVEPHQAREIYDEIISTRGRLNWTNGWTHFDGTETGETPFGWPIYLLEHFSGHRYNLVTGQVSNRALRKQEFRRLKEPAKSRVHKKVNARFKAITSQDQAAYWEGDELKIKRGDLELYWDLVDEVMLEEGLGPKPSAADLSVDPYENRKNMVLKRYQQRINAYKHHQIREYVTSQWFLLGSWRGDRLLEVADLLNEMEIEAIDYYFQETHTDTPQKNSSETRLVFNQDEVDNPTQMHAIVRMTKAYGQRIEVRLTSALHAADRALEGRGHPRIDEVEYFVRRFNDPIFNSLDLEQRLHLIRGLLRENADGPSGNSQKLVLDILESTREADAGSLIEALAGSDDTYDLFEEISDGLAERRTGLIDFLENLIRRPTVIPVFEKQFDLVKRQQTVSGLDRYANSRIIPYASPGLFKQIVAPTWSYDLSLSGKAVKGSISCEPSTWDYLTAPASFGPAKDLITALRSGWSREINFRPFDVIGLEVVQPDENFNLKHELLFLPAAALTIIQDMQDENEIQKWIDAGIIVGSIVLTVITMGAGASVLVAELVFASLMLADSIIQDFRYDIAQTKEGKEFLENWDLFYSMVEIAEMANVSDLAATVFKKTGKIAKIIGKRSAQAKEVFEREMRSLRIRTNDLLRKQADQASASAGGAKQLGKAGEVDSEEVLNISPGQKTIKSGEVKDELPHSKEGKNDLVREDNLENQLEESISRRLSSEKREAFLEDFGGIDSEILKTFEQNAELINAWNKVSHQPAWVRKNVNLLQGLVGKNDKFIERVNEFYSNLALPTNLDRPLPNNIKHTFRGDGIVVDYNDFGFPDFAPHMTKITVDGKNVARSYRGSWNDVANTTHNNARSKDLREATNWALKRDESGNLVNFPNGRVRRATTSGGRPSNSKIEILDDQGNWIEQTWHHHENGRDLIPVPSEIHNPLNHSGGFAAKHGPDGTLSGPDTDITELFNYDPQIN